MSKLGSKRLSKCKKAISKYLSNIDFGYSYFRSIDREKRNEVVSLIKFKLEFLAIIIIIYSLGREYFNEVFNSAEYNEVELTLIFYGLLIGIGTIYIFYKVLFTDYIPNREVSVTSMNISYYFIFNEIVASLLILICFLFNDRWIFTAGMICMMLFNFWFMCTIFFELTNWGRENKNEQNKKEEDEKP